MAEQIVNAFPEYVSTVLIAAPLLYAAAYLYINARDRASEAEDTRLVNSALESLSQNEGEN